jgi:DNA-binding MarR family transcriptional regulator
MLIELPCMCASVRRASRAMTQSYDDALRLFGLHATQFSILQVLSRTGELNQRQLSRILAADSTTLTRNLRLMRKRGWIVIRPGKDRRERWLQLSPSGNRALVRATPAWQRGQEQLRARLGEASWRNLQAVSMAVVSAVSTRDPEGELS